MWWAPWLVLGSYLLGLFVGSGDRPHQKRPRKPAQARHDIPATHPAASPRKPLHDDPRGSEGTNWRGPKVGWHGILTCVHHKAWLEGLGCGDGCGECFHATSGGKG